MDSDTRAGCTAARHGKISSYRDFGCRCPDTLERMRTHWREEAKRRPSGRRRGPRSRDQVVDEIAVRRAMAGDAVELTVLELHTAIDRLSRSGLSQRVVAERLRITMRTVSRSRAGAVKYGRPQPVETDVHRLSRGLSTVALDSDDEQDAA